MDRRTFLKTTGALVAGAAAYGASSAEHPMPRRTLGKTGQSVSLLGLGGSHVGHNTESDAVRLVHRALELGIDFIDSADCYQGGNSERYIGQALRGRREGVYLMTKVDARDRDGARRTLETSLRNFGVETIDLWQFHAVQSEEQVERIFGPDGAMEAAAAARKQGKVRHIGLTGHTLPAVLALAAREYHAELDALQMPINVCDPSYSSFLRQVLPLLHEHRIAPLAMKTAAGGNIVDEGVATVDECLRFALSQRVAVVISGMGTIAQLEHNVALVKTFVPMTEAEQEALVRRVSPHAGKRIENYKARV